MDEQTIATTEEFIDSLVDSDATPEVFRNATAVSLQLQLETNKLLATIIKHLENGIKVDTESPTNVYGEGLVEAIQNGIARGHQGISTNG